MEGPPISRSTVQLPAQVDGNSAHYLYSLDGGRSFHELGTAAQLRFSWWKGSRPALFAFTTRDANPGAVDFDWVHYRPLGPNPW